MVAAREVGQGVRVVRAVPRVQRAERDVARGGRRGDPRLSLEGVGGPRAHVPPPAVVGECRLGGVEALVVLPFSGQPMCGTQMDVNALISRRV